MKNQGSLWTVQPEQRTVYYIAYGLQSCPTHRPFIDIHSTRFVIDVVKEEITANVEDRVDAGSQEGQGSR
jgi:hypothetical protein